MSGKLRGQRAKSMKFVDGLMIHSGDPCNDYVDTACRHVLLRQGVLGIKVCDTSCVLLLQYGIFWCVSTSPSLAALVFLFRTCTMLKLSVVPRSLSYW